MTQSILIVDDHSLFRQGLVGLMRARRDQVTVVGEATNGLEAIQLAAKLQPDVILMDIQMPGMNGLEATEHIRQQFPHISVIILTASDTDFDLREAMQLGVSGYLSKDLDAEELFDLLEGIKTGQPAITRAMAARLMKCMTASASELDKRCAVPDLTAREIDVLRWVVRGSSNPQIADELCISVNTVKVHLRNILDKMHVKNRAEAAAQAVEQGLIA
ncbi:MAG: response regulator transcription factor [Chloroflexota bacterium]